jgi:hypothetical protein
MVRRSRHDRADDADAQEAKSYCYCETRAAAPGRGITLFLVFSWAAVIHLGVKLVHIRPGIACSLTASPCICAFGV